MHRFISVLCTVIILTACEQNQSIQKLTTPFESSDSAATATYEEALGWWKKLERQSPYVSLETFGTTDVGEPLHLVLINPERNFSFEAMRKSGKAILLINNAIHPGEPDGVDASMLLAQKLLSTDDYKNTYGDLILAIIPFYNVGGALNRNCCSRANQNGPASYGFRGNARNLDLNRDFVKADSKNAQSFLQLFNALNPDVYLETHVSNGADYPYTMTYLLSHPEKLTPPMDHDIRSLFEEPLLDHMASEDDEMIPYVNVHGSTPRLGFTAFYDTPRYSTGFTALVNCFGLLTETHMLKPYGRRVASTLAFMTGLANTIQENAIKIKSSRSRAFEYLSQQDDFALDYKVDKENPSKLRFKGYKSAIDTSTATLQPQHYFMRDSIWEEEIDYFNHLIPTIRKTSPKGYLVPRAWSDVVERLKWNGVVMQLIVGDSNVTATRYELAEFETSNQPYEGHYLHHATRVEAKTVELKLRGKEYYWVTTEQAKKRLIIELLEPEGPDSYFNWNFFDEVLQQKEWFSSYVFNEEAEEMMKDSVHRNALTGFLSANPGYVQDHFAQLYFLYKRSPHFERDRYMQYPVLRID